MNLVVANILWGVGTLLALVLVGVVVVRGRRWLQDHRARVATDADRDEQANRRLNQPDVDRAEAQQVANNSAARSAVNNRPPV